MKLEGERILKAKRSDVWERLIDASTLQKCIPGCQSITGSLDDGFKATIAQKIGPVNAKFHGNVTITDVVVGKSYTISGEGKGGVAGFAKGIVNVALSDHPEGTLLSYGVDGRIGGKLAQLGSRLVGGVAKKLSNQFFDRLQSEFDADTAQGD